MHLPLQSRVSVSFPRTSVEHVVASTTAAQLRRCYVASVAAASNLFSGNTSCWSPEPLWEEWAILSCNARATMEAFSLTVQLSPYFGIWAVHWMKKSSQKWVLQPQTLGLPVAIEVVPAGAPTDYGAERSLPHCALSEHLAHRSHMGCCFIPLSSGVAHNLAIDDRNGAVGIY